MNNESYFSSDNFADYNDYWYEICFAGNDILGGDFDLLDYRDGDHFARVWVDEKGYFSKWDDEAKEDLKGYLSKDVDNQMLITDAQSGAEMGTIHKVLKAIKESGFPIPSQPLSAEYSYTPFWEDDADDSIVIYWQE